MKRTMKRTRKGDEVDVEGDEDVLTSTSSNPARLSTKRRPSKL